MTTYKIALINTANEIIATLRDSETHDLEAANQAAARHNRYRDLPPGCHYVILDSLPAGSHFAVIEIQEGNAND